MMNVLLNSRDGAHHYKQCRYCLGVFRRRGLTLHQNKCPARVSVCASCGELRHEVQDQMTIQGIGAVGSGVNVTTCRLCQQAARMFVFAIRTWQANHEARTVACEAT